MFSIIAAVFAFIFSEQIIYSLIVPGLILGLGAILVSQFLPGFLYKIPVQLVGIALVLFFTYFAGRHSSDEEWKQKMAVQALIVEQLKAKSAEITTVTVTKFVDRIKIVEKINTEYQNVYIDKIITPEIDAKFGNLPDAFIVLHDSAANGVPITSGSPDAPSATPSAITLSEATKVIVDNYFMYHEVADQLTALQDWVNKQHQLLDKSK